MSLTKMKKSKRFVPIEEIKELYKQKEEIDKKIFSYNPNHCKMCGDTKPKHGFYPLLSFTYPEMHSSGFMCNKCALTSERYKELFKNKKNENK